MQCDDALALERLARREQDPHRVSDAGPQSLDAGAVGGARLRSRGRVPAMRRRWCPDAMGNSGCLRWGIPIVVEQAATQMSRPASIRRPISPSLPVGGLTAKGNSHACVYEKRAEQHARRGPTSDDRRRTIGPPVNEGTHALRPEKYEAHRRKDRNHSEYSNRQWRSALRRRVDQQRAQREANRYCEPEPIFAPDRNNPSDQPLRLGHAEKSHATNQKANQGNNESHVSLRHPILSIVSCTSGGSELMGSLSLLAEERVLERALSPSQRLRVGHRILDSFPGRQKTRRRDSFNGPL